MSKNLSEVSIATALSAPAPSPTVPRRRPLHVPKAPEIVATRIRKRIVSGELKDGDLLPSESHLMEDFCVSRPTIREAFRILEAERLITVARGARGGAFINAPDPELIRSYTLLVLQVAQTTVSEIFDTRRLLEPPIARELALKNSPESIRDLRACLEQEIAAMDDPLAFAAAAARFHRMLVVLSGNKPLIHLMDTITGVVELYQGMSMARDAQGLSIQEKRPQIERAMKSQKKLIDLIEQGKAPEAEEHWRKHMEISHRNWIQGYEDLTIQKLMAERNQL
jgi:DNA-binding FadR family transcriptional regulator